MNGWLGGESQRVDSVMTNTTLVFIENIAIGREDIITIRGDIDKYIVVGRVFLVPEHNGNILRLAILDGIAQRITQMLLVAGHGIGPFAIIAIPG
ncbi:hypothetical protein D3C76_1577010 [compost metagenome]